MEQLLYKYYELFSLRFTKSTCLVKNEIKNFLTKLSKQQDLKCLGDWFCWNYVAFQFEYLVTLNKQMEGRIPANWIFGPKALERWNNRNNEYWMYHVQTFLTSNNVVKPVEFVSIDAEKQYEQERRRFFNTDLGLFHCQQFAKFSAKSPSCMICKNKKTCKEIWK